MQRFRLALCAFPLVCAFSAHAAPIIFFGEDLNGDPFSRVAFPNALVARTAFLSQLGGSSTDTLEELTPNTLAPLTLTFSGISSTLLTGGNAAVRNYTPTDGFGEFATSGNNYIASDPNSALTITFSTPITSFGFYGTDFGDFAAGTHASVVFTGASGSIAQTINDTLGNGRGSTADGSVLFFGYINSTNPFTSVQINSLSDSFGLDDPVIGVPVRTAVPEPGTISLFAAGVLAVFSKKLRILHTRA